MKSLPPYFRCFVQRDGEVFVAVCIDLSLAVQADTLQEAREKLDALIHEYLHSAFTHHREHLADLLFRPAPLGQVARYHYLGAMQTLRRLMGRFPERKDALSFKEPACVPA